jgi:hypothetical protein
MMIGCKGRHGLPPSGGLLLIAGLVIAQNLQAAALRPCPHHGGPEHSIVDGPAGDSEAGAQHRASSPGAPHSGHGPSPTEATDSDLAPHDGPCDCLGPCGASVGVHAPASPTQSAVAEVAPRRVAVPAATSFGLALRARSFALPYPNAPPA